LSGEPQNVARYNQSHFTNTNTQFNNKKKLKAPSEQFLNT
jgi:hypothetical protein